jgi:CRISPR-associated protein Csm3
MKSKSFHHITGIITCKTGLHIGGTMEEIEIGGVDNPVLKHPITGEPYIPGSSFKGKMRSLLEHKYGKFGGKDGKDESMPCGCGKTDCQICPLFGAHMNPSADSGPTRILVRDMFFTSDYKERLRQIASDTGKNAIENKTENIVDRQKGIADKPRHLERVVADSEFDLDITLQVFEFDDENRFFELIKDGLSLMEKSYLGGYGSRGSGKIVFSDLHFDDKGFELS